MSCRVATVDDIPAICELARELNRLHHAALPSVFAPDSGPEHDEPHWRQSVLGSGNATFVAEVASRVVGFITLTEIFDDHILLTPIRYVKVNSVCVSPAARRTGFARALIATAEQWARARGAAEIRLTVYAFNEGAVQTWQDLGFSVRSHSMAKLLARHEA